MAAEPLSAELVELIERQLGMGYAVTVDYQRRLLATLRQFERALDACRVEHDDAMSAYRAAVVRAEAAEQRAAELERAVDRALQAPTYEAMEVVLLRLNVPIVLAPEKGADDER